MILRDRALVWPALLIVFTVVLLALGAYLRLITVERHWPGLIVYDETRRFQNAMWLRHDQPPLADAFGANQTARVGFPPVQLWVHAQAQRAVEARVPFPVPADYILGSRYVSMVFSLVTTALLVLTGWYVARPLGRAWAVGAGALTGLVWAVAPLVLLVTNLGIMDPLLYPFLPLAIVGAVYAVRSDSAIGAVVSLVFAILSIYTKYIMVYALWIPAVAVAVLVWRRGEGDRPTARFVDGLRAFWPWLALMAAISAVTAGWLLLGWDALALDNKETATFYDTGLANMLSPQRWYLNTAYVIDETVGGVLFGLTLVAGLAAWFISRRNDWPRAELWFAALLLPYAFFGILLISSIEVVTDHRARYTLAPMLGLLVLWGVALVQIAATASRWRRWLGPALLAVVAVWIVYPAVTENLARAERYREPLTEQVVWEWTEASIPNPEGDIVIFAREDNEWLRWVWDRTISGYYGSVAYTYALVGDVSDPAAYAADGAAYLAMTEIDYGNLDDTSAVDEMLLMGEIPPGAGGGSVVRFYRIAQPENAVDVAFGEQIGLRGYDLSADTVSPGDVLRLRLFWSAEVQPTTNYSLFVHLTAADDPTDIIAQHDGPPVNGTRLTPTWTDPDEVLVSDEITLAIPAEAAPGEYALRLGLYDFTTGVRLNTSDGADAYTVPIIVR